MEARSSGDSFRSVEAQLVDQLTRLVLWGAVLLVLCGLAGCTTGLSPATLGEWSYMVSAVFGAVAGALGSRWRIVKVCEKCANCGKPKAPRKPRKPKGGPELPFLGNAVN